MDQLDRAALLSLRHQLEHSRRQLGLTLTALDEQLAEHDRGSDQPATQEDHAP